MWFSARSHGGAYAMAAESADGVSWARDIGGPESLAQRTAGTAT